MNDAMLYVRPARKQLDEVSKPTFGIPLDTGMAVPGHIDAEPSAQSRGGYHRVLALDGDKWKPRPVYRTRHGGNGFGINYEQVMYTLNTVDKHIVAIL